MAWLDGMEEKKSIFGKTLPLDSFPYNYKLKERI